MEQTLYDSRGRAVAYIADDGETIYTWKGHAVAYVVDDKVYGWKGKHIGWFVDGVIYDGSGLRAGFLSGKLSCCRLRLAGEVRQVRALREVRPICAPRPAGTLDCNLQRWA